MHIRLKQRILYYLFIFVILVFFVKLMFSDRNACPVSTTTHQLGHSDIWNLNDHHVELEVKHFIENLKKSRAAPLPIGIPEIAHEDEDYITFKKPKLNIEWGHHQLGVIIPYRERFEELKEFVPYMDKYLDEKKINHKIFIINQVDLHRFNRASLINVGFLIARNESCDYIAMHDVDLLPLNKELNYGYPELGPFHVSAPHLHPKYHYKTFVGGILLVSVEEYEVLNGLSNKFWGWGREDDEFYMRIIDEGYEVHRHGDEITTGYETFKHKHSKERKRDYIKLTGQKEAMFGRDRVTGINDVKYEIQKRQDFFIDGSHCTIVDVTLHCDIDVTPWCNMPKAKRKH